MITLVLVEGNDVGDHSCVAEQPQNGVAWYRIDGEESVWRLALRRIYASVISLPLASRPNDANPASVNATTITVIASTAG